MKTKLVTTFSVLFIFVAVSIFLVIKLVSQNELMAGPLAEKTCAAEYERTSGSVSPDYQYWCCEGLTTFITDENDDPAKGERVGGGLICAKTGFERIENENNINNYKGTIKIGKYFYGYKK